MRVAELVSKYADAVLIVEAPLSAIFDSAGNPVGRVPFEKGHINGKTVTRYWYVGAGGAIGLGAIFFFSRLSELTKQTSGTINVIEGFVSFKTRRLDDKVDAPALLKGLRNPTKIELCQVKPNNSDERAMNMLGVTRLVSSEEPCPMVIVVTAEDPE